MNTINLLNDHLPPSPLPEDPEPGLCCVTGQFIMTVARKHGIKPTFTNLDLLLAPHSDRIGLPAWRVLCYTEPSPESKRDRRPLQQSSWLVTLDNGIEYLDRSAVRSRVLDGVDSPRWAGYVTTSYKKHGALRAPLNTCYRQVWLFEMLPVDCTDRQKVHHMWNIMRHAQDAGISRPIMETCEISAAYLAKLDWSLWYRFASWARPIMHDPLYKFLTYLLPSLEELKNA